MRLFGKNFKHCALFINSKIKGFSRYVEVFVFLTSSPQYVVKKAGVVTFLMKYIQGFVYLSTFGPMHVGS